MNRLLYQLGRLVTWLRSSEDADAEHGVGRRLCRFAALWGSIMYLAALIAVLLGMQLYTDRIWPFSVLVFLPPLGWLLPLALLTPVALICRRKALLVHVAALAALLIYMDPGLVSGPTQPGPGLAVRLVCNNAGSSMGTSPLAYVRERQPDLILLQETKRGMNELEELLPDYQVAIVGEFTIHSRWPILENTAPEALYHDGECFATRFVIDAPKHPFVVYNVHLPTRQPMLESMVGLGLRHDFGHGGIWSPEIRREFQSSMQSYVQLAERLAAAMEAESLPVLAAGDFNMPERGRAYERLTRHFADAHERTGLGFGYTVPASTRKSLALWEPWLRLDYLLADSQWLVLDFTTERRRRAQHRAISGTFFLPLEEEPKTSLPGSLE